LTTTPTSHTTATPARAPTRRDTTKGEEPTIDATAGTLKLTNVRDTSGKFQTGTFWGGTFSVTQTRHKNASTVLSLKAPLRCPAPRARMLAFAQKPPERHLWGRDNQGRFVTHGRTAVATVRGTAWLMRDTCAGTLVKVSRGAVSVHDLIRNLTVLVHAGRSYLAHAK
jgi:hypothetical protein